MESFYRYWNEKIKDWYVSPTTTFENDIYSNIYRTKAQNYKLKPEFLPEPYLGSIENNCAVIINKNPGKEITELQVHNIGKFLVNDEAHLNYQSFAKTFPYLL